MVCQWIMLAASARSELSCGHVGIEQAGAFSPSTLYYTLSHFSPLHRSLSLLLVGQVVLGVGEKPLGSGQLVFIRLACDPAKVGFYFAVASAAYRAASFGTFILSPLVAESSTYGFQASMWMGTILCFLSFLSAFPMLGKLKHLEPFLKAAPIVVGEEEGEEVILMKSNLEMEQVEEEEDGQSEDKGKSASGEGSWRGWRAYFQGLCNLDFFVWLVGYEGKGRVCEFDGLSHSKPSSCSLSFSRWPHAPCTSPSSSFRPLRSSICRQIIISARDKQPLPPHSSTFLEFSLAHFWGDVWTENWAKGKEMSGYACLADLGLPDLC